MSLWAVIVELGLGRHLEAALLGLPRLAVFLAFSPFLGGSTLLTGQMKSAVLLALYIFIHPLVLSRLPAGYLTDRNLWALAWLALKEGVLGFILAYVSGFVFWAVQSAGFLMDNQRGAGSATASDPLTGEETSLLGAFFSQFLVYLFFAGGAALSLLTLFFETYLFWPAPVWLPDWREPALPLFAAGLTAWLATLMCLLAGPVILASLLVDAALGLVNRFASQLNVYILAMPIKSGLAMLIALLLLSRFAGLAPALFAKLTGDVLALRQIWP